MRIENRSFRFVFVFIFLFFSLSLRYRFHWVPGGAQGLVWLLFFYALLALYCFGLFQFFFSCQHLLVVNCPMCESCHISLTVGGEEEHHFRRLFQPFSPELTVDGIEWGCPCDFTSPPRGLFSFPFSFLFFIFHPFSLFRQVCGFREGTGGNVGFRAFLVFFSFLFFGSLFLLFLLFISSICRCIPLSVLFLLSPVFLFFSFHFFFQFLLL